MTQLEEIERASNLVSLFLKRADAGGDKPFLGRKVAGEWQTISWREVADQVCLLAENLRGLGLRDGDRVMLVSENRPEWCISDLAIMAAGCITVPAYTTNTERDHVHILDNSGARAVIVSNEKLSGPLIPAIFATGIAEHIIPIESVRGYQGGNLACHGWERMTQGDAKAARAAVDARIAKIGRRDTACIIYTSGTGGAPRGVLQHHGAILCNVAGAADILIDDFDLSNEERFLSFLPLSHAYEHTGGQFLPIGVGAQIFYAEGLEKLASNIEETSPTVMVVVPRLFEVLRTRIMKQIAKQGGAASYLLDRALEIEERAAAKGRKRLRDKPMDAQDPPEIRRPDQGDGFGRRAAQPRCRDLFPGARPADDARLWPDRGGAGDQLQQAFCRRVDGHSRPADEGRRGEDRRGWRDPVPG